MRLEEVLQFREKKALLQQRMMEEHPDAVIVSLGMNIPGPVKCSPLIRTAFYEGMERLEELLGRERKETLYKVLLEERAGYAAIYLTGETDLYRIKKETVSLEETHPLGRIWDIDVFGNSRKAVEREAVGAQRRKCLLCGCDAKECARSRKHETGELQKKVTEIILHWQAGKES